MIRTATILCLLALSAVFSAAAEEPRISFGNDVMPVLAKAGCSSGNCHSKPEGQNNFKLSVFGYDPALDYREIVLDDRGRRLFPAAPEQSLLLRKASGAIPHEGGVRIEQGSSQWKLIVTWIRQGMPFTPDQDPKLTGITLEPRERVYAQGATQPLKIIARYSDNSTRDVTALSDYVSQDRELATVDEHGMVTAGSNTGEGVVVVRYMGMVDVARITVPAKKTYPATTYAALPAHNDVDKLVHARLQKLGLLPSAPCSDAEFLRRASLDAIGMLPPADLAASFLASREPDKREKLVDQLLAHPNYADHWAIKWGDLVRPNPSRVGVKPVLLMDRWLRESFRENKPYNQMVRELLTASGSTHQTGPVALWRDKREPVDASGFISQIFLGVRLDCAKCHHHPSEKWTQEDYYQLGAFFARIKHAGQGISAPISGEPEFMWPGDKGELTHPVTDAVMVPKPPDGPEMPYVKGQDPRAALADWMASSENPFFARAIVNRLWAEFFGRGIVEPVDDMRVSNPPSNEPLLAWLAQDFVSSGYDLRHLMRTMMLSSTYQLSATPNATNVADTKNFSRSYKRRLSAEVLADAVNDLLATSQSFEGLPTGSRAVQTWNHKLGSDFLDAFGRPNASQECPCERDRKSSVVQALHMMNSSDMQEKLSSDGARANALAKGKLPEPQIVRQLYLTAFNRTPRAEELQAALRYFATPGLTRETAVQDLLWSLMNSAEFVFNH